MDTTTAANSAGVTVATIRHWCRYGAVTATKVAGRWVIDEASLAHRITIGATMPDHPTEHAYDTDTTIRISRSAWSGRYIAEQYRNGYRISTIADGATAGEAYAAAVDYLNRRAEAEMAAEKLEATGLYADLTIGPRPGIHASLQALVPSPARTGECHYCGLTKATCDCR